LITYESEDRNAGILSKLDALVFGRTHYRCVSHYDWNASQERLAAVIDTRSFLGLHWQAGIVGRVGSDRVEAYRQSWWYHNSFRPVFRGRLASAGKAVVLEGSFSMFPSVKAFLIIWTVFAITVGVGSLLLDRSSGVNALVFSTILLFFVVLLVGFGRLFNNGDIRVIADAMDAALTT